MAKLTIEKVRLKGITACVPSTEVDNFKFEEEKEGENLLRVNTIGIHSRRLAKENETAADLCIKAANKLMEGLEWTPDCIDILVFVTQTPDYQLPGNSMVAHDKLGLNKDCAAIDIHQGCAGYVYGLSTISSYLQSGKMRRGLLLVGDTITKLLDPKDMGTIPIFSDAGSATALEFDSNANDLFFNLQTYGSAKEAIHMSGSGTRKNTKDPYMRMNGHEIFTFGLKEVSPNVEELLSYAETDKESVDFYIFHQANQLLNTSIQRKLKIPEDKMKYSLKDYGNTSCATIPLTIVHSLKDGNKLIDGRALICGFGVGLSWASGLIDFKDVWTDKIIIHED